MDLVEDVATVAWPQEAIHMEFFAADPLASSGPRQPFEITLARARATYSVPAERSILQVLAEHGIRVSNVPEYGVCRNMRDGRSPKVRPIIATPSCPSASERPATR
jgi:vanillate O-demethylase ferredoxin subunit